MPCAPRLSVDREECAAVCNSDIAVAGFPGLFRNLRLKLIAFHGDKPQIKTARYCPGTPVISKCCSAGCWRPGGEPPREAQPRHLSMELGLGPILIRWVGWGLDSPRFPSLELVSEHQVFGL